MIIQNLLLNPEDIGPGTTKAAERVTNDILAVKTGERVLIVGNPEQDSRIVASSMYHAARRSGGTPKILFQPKKEQFEPAEEEVLAGIRETDVFISVSTRQLGSDPKGAMSPYVLPGGRGRVDHILMYCLATERVRACWSPGITAEIFGRAVDIDYDELGEKARSLQKLLIRGHTIRVSTSSGTELEVNIGGRYAFVDHGYARMPGTSANIPCGEVGISPVPGSARGKIVFDGSMALHTSGIIIEEPIEVDVQNGKISRITGGSEAILLGESIEFGRREPQRLATEGKIQGELAEQYTKNADSVAEFGIGLNPKARLSGCVVEDEKVLGTCHVAFGSNYGDALALLHLDGVLREPTVHLVYEDGKKDVILDKGRICSYI